MLETIFEPGTGRAIELSGRTRQRADNSTDVQVPDRHRYAD